MKCTSEDANAEALGRREALFSAIFPIAIESEIVTKLDVIVIGAGHAGFEAAYAAARLGARSDCARCRETVAHMPCNPAVGGTAKGHLVREIDALGGLMGRAIDATGIQFKLLNRSRGPAVWSPRAQADKTALRRVGARARSKPSRTSSGFSAGPAGFSSSTAAIVGLALEDGAVSLHGAGRSRPGRS